VHNGSVSLAAEPSRFCQKKEKVKNKKAFLFLIFYLLFFIFKKGWRL